MTNETMDALSSHSVAPVADREPRCWRCKRKLAELVSRPWEIVCTRCKARNVGAAMQFGPEPSHSQ